MMEETKYLWELPITNNLADLTFNGMFDDDDDDIEQKPILQQDEKKIDIVPQTCCININVESEAHSDDGNVNLKKEVDCAQMSLIDIPTNLPILENITSDSDTVLQTCNIKLEPSFEDFFDGENHHLKREVDCAQMSVNDIPGVIVFCNERVAELKENKKEENTTACSGNGAMHSQISSLTEKSQCELCGAEFTQAGSLMVHRSVYHRQDQQTLLTQDSNVIEEKELGIDHLNDGNYINSDLHKTVIYSKTKNSHKCSVCNKTFNHLVILKTLQGINTGQKIYKCIECKIDLSSKLDGYQGIHSKNKPEMSTDFKMSKIHANSIQINQHISKEGKHYKCKECGMTFNQSDHLKTHQNVHKDIKPYKCNACGKTFINSCKLNVHIRIHTGEKPYRCTDCGKAFNQYCTLERHQYIHKGIKPYKCNTCGKAFTHVSSLKDHIRIHTGEKPYRCTDCGKAYKRSFSLKIHKNIHTREKSLCDVCGQSFDLYRHLKTHQNTCGKAFIQFSHLKLHKKIHAGEKPYRCTDCGKSFNSACYLKIHQNIHKGIKPCKCNTCGKAFSAFSYLKVHIRIHTGEKPYRCTDCGKAFNNSSSLKTHQNIHKDIKPYKCNTCGKSFRHSNSLKGHHIRIHTGEKNIHKDKPYKCNTCGKSFGHPKSLKRHIRIHIGEKP